MVHEKIWEVGKVIWRGQVVPSTRAPTTTTLYFRLAATLLPCQHVKLISPRGGLCGYTPLVETASREMEAIEVIRRVGAQVVVRIGNQTGLDHLRQGVAAALL